MPRLIDADALTKLHCEGCAEDVRAICKDDPVCASLMWVTEAPTIEAEPDWISVDKALPPYNLDVLTYTPGMAIPVWVDCYAGYYGEDDEEWHEGWVRRRHKGVTYWRPMPKLPAMKED